MLNRSVLSLWLLFFSLAPSALASIIYTYNDSNPITSAGPLPASSQDLRGLSPEIIYGNLGPNPTAINVFEIDISSATGFSAFTVDGGSHHVDDTELFLFDINGMAVYGNDDISSIDTFSCLPSSDGSNPCPSGSVFGPLASGSYYLAVTRSNQMPWNSANNYLFMQTSADSTLVVGPDLTAGGANPVAGWDGGAYTEPDYDNSYYEIFLAGTAVPEPGTFALFGGLMAVGFLTRRFWIRKSV